MVLRLSELLERIRPTGTPGAPGAGDVQRDHDQPAGEFAELTDLLATFEQEADALIETAAAEAEQRRAEARRRAHHWSATLPDLLAGAEAEATIESEGHDVPELERLQRELAASITELEERATTQIPPLVDLIVDTILSLAPPVTSTQPTRASPRSPTPSGPRS